LSRYRRQGSHEQNLDGYWECPHLSSRKFQSHGAAPRLIFEIDFFRRSSYFEHFKINKNEPLKSKSHPKIQHCCHGSDSCDSEEGNKCETPIRNQP
jgi:hypothetical protein